MRVLKALLVCGLLLALPASAWGQTGTRLWSESRFGTIAANGETVTIRNILGAESVRIQALDTYNGTWELQCSLDGVTFDTDDEINLILDGQTTTVQAVTDAVGIWKADVGGCSAVRIAATAGFAASDVTLRLNFTSTGGGGGSGSGAGGDASAANQTTEITHLDAIQTAVQLLDNAISGVGFNISQVGGVAPTAAMTADFETDGDTQTGEILGLAFGSAAGAIPATGAVEDVAETAAAVGMYLFSVRRDTAASSAGTTGDVATVNTDANGLTWTRTMDPCSALAKTYIPIDVTTATTTELTAALAGASTHYYVCALNLVTTAANNVSLVDDNTDGCGSVTAALIGGLTAAEGWNFAANGGIVLGSGSASVLRTVTTNAVLCLVTSAITQLSGHIVVVAAP